MRTDDLIAGLARQAGPVRPLAPPWVRQAWWLVGAIASPLAAIAILGPRHDLGAVTGQPWFVWTMSLVICLATCAAGAALVLAIPGAAGVGALRGVSLASFGLWSATLVTSIGRGGQGFAAVSDWPVCFSIVSAVSLVPAVWLLVLLRRAAPLHYGWTGSLALAAAAAVGATAIQVICPQNDPAHALLGHFGPVLVAGGLGALAGRRLVTRALQPNDRARSTASDLGPGA